MLHRNSCEISSSKKTDRQSCESDFSITSITKCLGNDAKWVTIMPTARINFSYQSTI